MRYFLLGPRDPFGIYTIMNNPNPSQLHPAPILPFIPTPIMTNTTLPFELFKPIVVTASRNTHKNSPGVVKKPG